MTSFNIQHNIQTEKETNNEAFQTILSEIKNHITDGRISFSKKSNLYDTFKSDKAEYLLLTKGFSLTDLEYPKEQMISWSHSTRYTSPEFENIFSQYESSLQSSKYFSEVQSKIKEASLNNKSKLFIPYYGEYIELCKWLDMHQDYFAHEQNIHIKIKGFFTNTGVKISWFF
mgnify:FL=1